MEIDLEKTRIDVRTTAIAAADALVSALQAVQETAGEELAPQAALALLEERVEEVERRTADVDFDDLVSKASDFDELKSDLKDLKDSFDNVDFDELSSAAEKSGDVDNRCDELEGRIEELEQKTSDMPDPDDIPDKDTVDDHDSRIEDLERKIGDLDELTGLDVEVLTTAESTISEFQETIKAQEALLAEFRDRLKALEAKPATPDTKVSNTVSLSDLFAQLGTISGEIAKRFAKNEADSYKLT